MSEPDRTHASGADRREENPVVNGLVALAAVAVVVGLLGGLGVMTATKVLGLNDASNAAADSAGEEPGESLYMPKPVPTDEPSGPLVTLAPTDDEPFDDESTDEEIEESEEPSDSESAEEEGRITLSQGAFEVAPGEQLYLSGIYPGGEGTVLDIEYKTGDGRWEEFPIDVNVANETFSTYVETYRSGDVYWRVVDSDEGVKSNEVKVTYTP